MSINNIFPEEELSKTEKDILLEIFSNSTVKRYLRIIGTEAIKELSGLSALGNNDGTISKAHATVNGKLSVISTLLSIEGDNQPLPTNGNKEVQQ